MHISSFCLSLPTFLLLSISTLSLPPFSSFLSPPSQNLKPPYVFSSYSIAKKHSPNSKLQLNKERKLEKMADWSTSGKAISHTQQQIPYPIWVDPTSNTFFQFPPWASQQAPIVILSLYIYIYISLSSPPSLSLQISLRHLLALVLFFICDLLSFGLIYYGNNFFRQVLSKIIIIIIFSGRICLTSPLLWLRLTVPLLMEEFRFQQGVSVMLRWDSGSLVLMCTIASDILWAFFCSLAPFFHTFYYIKPRKTPNHAN